MQYLGNLRTPDILQQPSAKGLSTDLLPCVIKMQCKGMWLHIGSAIVSSCTALMWLRVHTCQGPETYPAAPVEGTADEERVEVEAIACTENMYNSATAAAHYSSL